MEEQTPYKKKMKAPSMKILKTEATETPFNSKEKRKYDPRPSVRFVETDLPEIKDWTVNKNYKLNVEVEMIGIREEDYGNDKGKFIGEFKIAKVGVASAE